MKQAILFHPLRSDPSKPTSWPWYLERYTQLPSGVFQQRARQVEQKLSVWGRQLYDVAPC